MKALSEEMKSNNNPNATNARIIVTIDPNNAPMSSNNARTKTSLFSAYRFSSVPSDKKKKIPLIMDISFELKAVANCLKASSNRL